MPSNSRCSLKVRFRPDATFLAGSFHLGGSEFLRTFRARLFVLQVIGKISRRHEDSVFLKADNLIADSIQEKPVVTNDQGAPFEVDHCFLEHPQGSPDPDRWLVHRAREYFRRA